MKTKTIILIISLITLGMTSSVLLAQQSQTKTATSPSLSGKVESSYVCYVNNKYMGKEQIPVEVNGKTYYGCCQGCVGNLKNNRKVRYSTDPYTGEEVDKATAYIVVKGNGSQEVYYFRNRANYEKFKKNAGS